MCQRSRHIAVFVVLLLCSGWIFSHGYPGSFHLDDHENLRRLSYAPKQASLAEAVSFGLTQVSGATRLLPELTFVMQAEAWPAKPGRFITFNILLHLINGFLVYLLAQKLARLGKLPHAGAISLLTASIWLLSPIQVSAVLYIIQRINQVSALFVFLGAICYLHGRERIEETPLRGISWMSFGVAVCGLLAVISKENGALLPLLLLAAEATVLPRLTASAFLAWARRLLLYVPLLLLALALVWQHNGIMAGYAMREFTWEERLLTQAGVLLDYQARILLPRGFGLGLFHDDYPVVYWPPGAIDTLKVVVVAALVACALFYRYRWPMLAFGILWYFAGHALEASWIPLELYFEHRNYIPLFGSAFALAALSVYAIESANVRLKPILGLFVIGWLALMSWVTYGQASLWGKPPVLLQVWHMEHPRSARAASDFAELLAQSGDLTGAAEKLAALAEGPEPYPALYGQWLRLGCRGDVRLPESEAVLSAFRSMRYSVAPVNGLASIADLMERGACARLHPIAMLRLARALQSNSKYGTSRPALHSLAGRFLELAGQYEGALAEIRAAFELTGNPELGFIEVRLLSSLGRDVDAMRRLDTLESYIHSAGLKYVRYRGDVEAWRGHLDKARATVK